MSLKKYIAEAVQAKTQPVTGDKLDISINAITNIKATVVEHANGAVLIELDNAALKLLESNGLLGDEEYEDEEEYMPAAGDVVRIDHPSEHNAHLGEVVEVAPSGNFAYVEFKDGSVESYHSSNLIKVADEEAYAYFDDEGGNEDDEFDEGINTMRRLSGMKEGSTYDTSPGSPFDRGKADAYYGRRGNPTKVVDKPNATVRGERMIVQLTDPAEIKAYYAGYEGSEFGEKDYGSFPDTSDDVDEGFEDWGKNTSTSTDPSKLKNVVVTSPSGKTYTFDTEEDARRLFLDKWHVVKNPSSGWMVDLSNVKVGEAAVVEAPAQMGSYLGIKALKAPPLKNYRPAIWENMLGTVYAMNDAEKIKYFDHDHKAAMAYAGIGPDSAPRLYRIDRHAAGRPHGEYSYGGEDSYASPRHGKLVLFIKKNQAVGETSAKSLAGMQKNDLMKTRQDGRWEMDNDTVKMSNDPKFISDKIAKWGERGAAWLNHPALSKKVDEVSPETLDSYITKAARGGTSNRIKGVTTALGKVNDKFGWRGEKVRVPAGKSRVTKDKFDETINVFVRAASGKITGLKLTENVVFKNDQWTSKIWTK